MTKEELQNKIKSIRDIAVWPNSYLSSKSEYVEQSLLGTSFLSDLLDDLETTMVAADGIGIAGAQICVNLRVAVAQRPARGGTLVGGPVIHEGTARVIDIINPVIVEASGPYERQEGCLSIPGEVMSVPRFQHVKVMYLDRSGKEFTEECNGLWAAQMQHELDHMDGICIAEKCTSSLRRKLVLDNMKRFQKKIARGHKVWPPRPRTEG